ncbi:MAG: hypothetical protein M3Y24_09525 [Acidobacteriota bacterium]|nr:hypothetical protein [Acidobacteriota bacterium]
MPISEIYPGLLQRHHFIGSRALQQHDHRYISQVSSFPRRGCQVANFFVRRQDSHRIRILLAGDLNLSIFSLGEGVAFCPALLAGISKELTKQEQLLPESIVVDIIFASSTL